MALLVRHYGRGHLHFIASAFTCDRRWPLLRSVASGICSSTFWATCATATDLRWATWSCPNTSTCSSVSRRKARLPRSLEVLKQRVSRRLRRKKRNHPQQFRLAFRRRRRLAAPLLATPLLRFQRVESQEESEKLHYMHMNPLKRNWLIIPRTGPGAVFHSIQIPNTD